MDFAFYNVTSIFAFTFMITFVYEKIECYEYYLLYKKDYPHASSTSS